MRRHDEKRHGEGADAQDRRVIQDRLQIARIEEVQCGERQEQKDGAVEDPYADVMAIEGEKLAPGPRMHACHSQYTPDSSLRIHVRRPAFLYGGLRAALRRS